MQTKRKIRRILSSFLALVLVIGMLPINSFAEVKKADWTIDETKEAEMSYWKLSNTNEVTVVANAEGIKTPSINYIGTYVNDEGRTVIRLSFRMFQNLASGVWQKALFKFDNDLYNLIDFKDPGTGMYKGARNNLWHDSDTYNEVYPFTDVVSSISGAVNVKEQNLNNNGNKVGGSARLEIPIDLVLKEGQTVDNLVGQPHVQMRITNKDYSKVFCVAGTGNASSDSTNNDDSAVDPDTLVTPYNSYTFMTYVPSKNNNASVGTVEDYRIDQQFYAANSYAKYNQAGGYLDVFHKQSKLASGDDIGGEAFAFRQVFNEKFAKVLKPQDKSGTVAEVFPASQQGEPWSNVEKIKITQSDLNTSQNSDLNPGFTGIQVATNKVGNIPQKFAGLNTVFTTASAKTSYLNGTTTEFNSGLPTITRYYVDPEKVAAEGLKDDDLAAFDFYSTFILEGTRKFIEYSATNDTGSDIILQPNTKLTLTYDGGSTSTPNLNEDNYSLIFGEEPYKIELRSNFNHVGKGSTFGKIYEYTLVPGMTIKAGEKITFRTMKYQTPPNNVTLTLPGVDGEKQIVLNPGADGAEKTTPRRLNYITTYAGGSATQTGLNPDIDELFTDSKNITGRTRYKLAVIKLFYPDGSEYPFTIADQDTRTEMNINGAEKNINAYTFTTEGKTGFTMPDNLVKDSVIGITNTDVRKASVPSEKVEEKVQAKVTFDLNGGKLPTTTKSFQGYAENALPGTEFAYKLDRANETDPVVRIAPMNEKAASDEGYTPNGFKVATYIDHNGDELTGDALELRKIVENPTKDGLEFYGWTTKKVETVDEYNALEELKTAEQTKDTTKAYKFTENSPIITGTTVYAFYGPSKSLEANPVQKYDEKDDKQYIEGILPEGKTLPENAKVELVQKNADGSYTPVNVPVDLENGTASFDVKNENIKHGGEYYIAVTEEGKPTTYSTNSVKIDKQAPEFVGDIAVEQDAYNYKAKISATAKDKNNILKIYVKDSQNKGYYDAEAKLSEASMQPQLELHQGAENKEFTVIAVDKFGNKIEKTVKLENTFKPLTLKGQDPYVGDKFIYVKADKGAVLNIKVQDDFGDETFLEMTHTANGEFEKIDLDESYEINDFDMVVITATKDGNTSATLSLYAQ